jgi:hypothetical protein
LKRKYIVGIGLVLLVSAGAAAAQVSQVSQASRLDISDRVVDSPLPSNVQGNRAIPEMVVLPMPKGEWPTAVSSDPPYTGPDWEPAPQPPIIQLPPPDPSQADFDCSRTPYEAKCLSVDPEGVYAAGLSVDAVRVLGNGNVFSLPVVSGGGVSVSGNNNKFNFPVSSVQTPMVKGNNNQFSGLGKALPVWLPNEEEVRDFEAGSPGLVRYPASVCSGGELQLNAASITAPVFSECALTITGNNVVVTASIVSTRPVRVLGNGLTFRPTFLDDAFLILVSGPDGLVVEGNKVSVLGRIRTSSGG